MKSIMLKITRTLQLLFLLVILRDVLAISSISCKVPVTENGKMGRTIIQNRRWIFQEEFVEVHPGEEINSNETLLLRCMDGFMPTENSKFSESIQVEVTCIDGKWSKGFECYQTSCTGDPPVTANTTPVISSRKHGYQIWYRCNNKNLVKMHGSVTCHFGSWIGNPPKCLNYPCLTRSLMYPGLVKPPQQYLESNDSFEIQCEHGFRKERSVSKITCERGQWDITQNPCTDDRDGVGFIFTTPLARTPPTRRVPYNIFVTPSNHQVPDIESSRECFCTYDYENYFMKAQLRRKILKRGDKIMRGETVSFECKFVSRVLSWQNGLRFFGRANMTCSICEKWQSRDLPTCSYTERSHAVIGSDEDLQVLPGGTVEIRGGESHRFFCSNTVIQPQWNYGEKVGVSVNKTEAFEDKNVTYISYLEIMKVEKEHRGRYECLTLPGRIESAFLYLQVKDIACSFFTLGNGLSVYYSNSNKINSLASFSCPVNAKLVGNPRARCKNDGTWTSIQPNCEFEEKVSCSRFPSSPGLEVKYSRNLSAGSIASFSCSPSSRNLVGSSLSTCEENGRWSNPLPSCTDAECSIGDLSLSIPQTVEPDMIGVNSEFVASGYEMRLKCSDNSILQGNSKILCGEDGKWNLDGSYVCVPGCFLNIDPSSHLLIHPVKDSYRFGDFVLLSCPPGKEMSQDVERLMCLGGTWTDSLPFCEE